MQDKVTANYPVAEHPSRLIAVGQIEDSEGWGAAEHEKSVSEFERMLREVQDRGEFRDFSPRLMAVTLLAALEATPRSCSPVPTPTSITTRANSPGPSNSLFGDPI